VSAWTRAPRYPAVLTTSLQPLIGLLLLAVVYYLQTSEPEPSARHSETRPMCLVVDLASTAVGLFIMLARQSGICCNARCI